MEETLLQLLEVDGVLGVLLVSPDGLPVAAANMEEHEAETVGALASVMVASVRTTTDRLAFGALTTAHLRTNVGCLQIHTIGDLILMILHEHETDESTLAATLPPVTDYCREFTA